jgi:hypothetical protein
MDDRYVEVDVEPSEAHEDGVSMRFKRTVERTSGPVAWVCYESETGVEGRWRTASLGAEGVQHGTVMGYEVEDSSDGVVRLIVGGTHGLVLTHEQTGTREVVPYLVLSTRSEVGSALDGGTDIVAANDPRDVAPV